MIQVSGATAKNALPSAEIRRGSAFERRSVAQPAVPRSDRSAAQAFLPQLPFGVLVREAAHDENSALEATPRTLQDLGLPPLDSFTPRRDVNSLIAAATENRAAEVRAAELRAIERQAGELRAAESRASEPRAPEGRRVSAPGLSPGEQRLVAELRAYAPAEFDRLIRKATEPRVRSLLLRLWAHSRGA